MTTSRFVRKLITNVIVAGGIFSYIFFGCRKVGIEDIMLNTFLPAVLGLSLLGIFILIDAHELNS